MFCTGTAEFLVAGIWPDVAIALRVTVAVAGQTVTAYAIGRPEGDKRTPDVNFEVGIRAQSAHYPVRQPQPWGVSALHRVARPSHTMV